jgi:NitT/TauT family transport system ATP-binding protein
MNVSSAVASRAGHSGAGAGLSVELQDIRMAFGEGEKRVDVIDGISTVIEPGEFCCIVGPSGCGKSTLLRLIQALLAPAGGRVLLDGKPVVEPSPEIGFVFQQFNLLPWRTVLGNVEFGLENRKVPKRERRSRAQDFIRRVDLVGFEDHYPAQLSGGMQQRVGLARALAIGPRLLLMDEPFGSVDSQTKMLLQAELVQLWEADAKTVVFITHDIEEALFLGDVVYVLGPRPSTIESRIEVPFARPRTDALRANPEFARLREEIWESLKQGILNADRRGETLDG